MRAHQNRIWSVLLSLALLLTLLPTGTLAAEYASSGNWIDSADTTWYDDHSDSASFEIATPEELAGLAKLVNEDAANFSGKTIALSADIDLAGKEWTPIGGTNTGKYFAGTFDGGAHTISNLNIARGIENEGANNRVGLFGACTSAAKLQAFTLNNVDVAGCLQVAAVLGGSGGAEAKITDVHVTGNVKVFGWWYVGGILGKGYSTISNCSVTGDGTDSSYVKITGGYAGGIVGFMGEDNCVTTGCTVANITVEGAHNGIGGINGILHYGNTISDCTVENVVVWQNTDPAEDGRIYCGAFAGTYLDNNGKTPPTLRNCTFTGELYSGADRTDVLESNRYVGSLWYGAEPPATITIEDCTIHMPPVAQVGSETYGTLTDAFQAAKNGQDQTVTMLADVTEGNWNTIRDFTGITLEGNGHVLTVNCQAFHSGGGNTFRNLTVDLSGAAQSDCAFYAAPNDTFTNVTVKGNSNLQYGILVSGTDAEDETITIDGCTFDTMTHGVYDSESGAVEHLMIQNSTFTGGARLIFRSANGRFVGNTVRGAALDIMGGAQTVTNNTFTDGSRVSFHLDGPTFQDNQLGSKSYLEFTGATAQNRDLRGNDFGEELIITAQNASAAITLPAGPVKSGYTFAGWNDGAQTYQAGDPYNVTQNVTFTAQWTEHTSTGGSSSGSTSSGNQTQTTTNPDGSTTITVTKPNGTVTETTTDTSGNKTQIVTKPDGSSETTVTNKDGSSSTTTVDQNGKVDSEVNLPADLVNTAAESGETVSLPIPAVPATSDKENAPTVTVALPSGTAAKVEIPVADVTPGTVAVIVKADGTEAIIKTSLTTENGVAVTLSNGDTVKIVDNTKLFDDVDGSHWGADEIAFTTSRELFQGTGVNTFSPEEDMTRAMVVSVLARYEGVDTAGGDTWYELGAQWAVEHGVSDGSNLDDAISREQLATMLWRYMGSPAASADLNGHPDHSDISDWAYDAMIWAVDHGLITGNGAGQLDPQRTATRAEVAAILARFVALTA